MIAQKVRDARFALEQHKKGISPLRFEQNRLESELEKIEQAAIDYMTGNGLLDCDSFRLGVTHSVDCPDIEAVPEEFVRVKMVREPNKILIKELKPEGANWYVLKTNYKLTVK
jgi:hypothetical protein